LEEEHKILKDILEMHKKNEGQQPPTQNQTSQSPETGFLFGKNQQPQQDPKKPDWEAHAQMIQTKIQSTEWYRLSLQQQQVHLDLNMNSLDLCILMDCTGSMGPYIEMCKRKLIELVELVTTHYSNKQIEIRISFVGYHDYADTPRFRILPFTNDAKQVVNWVTKNVQAAGGNDIPEDVVGGLREALNLDWKSAKRLIVFIADAPCHGQIYHDCQDNQPEGDPVLIPEVLLGEMMSKNIVLFFSNILKETDKMISIWRKFYAGTQLNRTGFNLNTFGLKKDEDFLYNIADAVGGLLNS